MKRTTATLLSGLALTSALSLVPGRPAGATTTIPVTGRASVLPGAQEPTVKGDARDPKVDTGGRFVAFSTKAQLSPADTDTVEDVYLRDLISDRVELVSVSSSEVKGADTSRAGAVSLSGHQVVFWSWSTNLVAGDTNAKADVFVRDLDAGTTERVSVSSSEVQGNGASPSLINGDSLGISADGRYVTFTSTSTNLGPDGNTLSDVFVRDRVAGTTELISVSSAEAPGGAVSYVPSITSTGRYVAFQSDAANLVAGDTNGATDVFVRDREAGNTYRVSLTDGDVQGANGAASTSPKIDAGGTKVAFTSTAPLATGDTNGLADVYVRDRNALTTTLISVGVGSTASDAASTEATISGDGKTVAWTSTASNLVSGGSNGWPHIYVRTGATTTRASVAVDGAKATAASAAPSLSSDGKVVAFDSKASNLTPGDTGYRDAFFRAVPRIGPSTTLASFATLSVGHFAPGAPSTPIVTAMQGGSSPAHQLVVLADAPGWSAKRAPLTRLYVAYFKRLPDLGGFEYWRKKLAGGTKLDQVSATFAASSEFTTKYGSTTNTTFVTLVYQNVLGRQPDASGLAHWVAKLQGGMSRGSVMTQFSESSEGRRHAKGWVEPTLLTLGMLGAMPSGALFVDMKEAAELDTTENAALILLESAAYAAKVV